MCVGHQYPGRIMQNEINAKRFHDPDTLNQDDDPEQSLVFRVLESMGSEISQSR